MNDWNQRLELIVFNVISSLQSIKINNETAVVFDIDDTLIDSRGKRIDLVFFLYNYMKYLGIHLVLITNRIGTQESVQWTIDELFNNGITKYSCIYFRSPYREDNPYRYKEIARKSVLEKKGLTIIMSIGDQPWDIGNYGGIGILLPICPQVQDNYFL